MFKKKKRCRQKPFPSFLNDESTKALFKHLQYSYNWLFVPHSSPILLTEDETVRNYVALQMLDFELYKLGFSPRFNCMSIRSQSQLSLALQVQPSAQMMVGIGQAKTCGVEFAPNWNTLIGLRGVQLMLRENETRNQERPNLRAYLREMMMFRRRFVQMFYWTALLAKVPVSLVNMHWLARCTQHTETETIGEPLLVAKEELVMEEEEIVDVHVDAVSDGEQVDDEPAPQMTPHNEEITEEEERMRSDVVEVSDGERLDDEPEQVQACVIKPHNEEITIPDEESMGSEEEEEDENAVDFLLSYVNRIRAEKNTDMWKEDEEQLRLCGYEMELSGIDPVPGPSKST